MEDETTQTPNCRHCNSSNTIRHGYTTKGSATLPLPSLRALCGRCFVQDPGTAAYDPARKEEEILCAYHERTSLRGLSRIFGVSPNTVTRWLKKSPEPATVGANTGSRRERGGPGAR
jgi:transposase-like protein